MILFILITMLGLGDIPDGRIKIPSYYARGERYHRITRLMNRYSREVQAGQYNPGRRYNRRILEN